ncbi:Rne/Rng family ribonuclease [Cellulomonas shaoxiangyii]|uniref:Rne/Rng family ribonuclease n=1 Tax=Cellulomonas shaoxiangyii TaxID=2566013 RepID=UPI001FC9D912|nr:Rne/Rng family ribonuclease [Cellulomonas shaoxiangyii]
MSPENTPDISTDATTTGGEAPTRRRRRVTRDVVTPPIAGSTGTTGEPAAPATEPSAPAAQTAPVAAPAPAAESEPAPAAVADPASAQAPAAPARARRSRRVTRTVVLPDTAAQADVATPAVEATPTAVEETDEAAAELAAAELAAAESAPAETPAPRARRSRRKTAAPVEAPDAAAPVDGEPVAAEPVAPQTSATEVPVAEAPAADETAEAPAKKAPRRRASRRATASVEDAGIDTALETTAAAPSAADETVTQGRAPQLDVLAELGGVRTESAPETSAPTRARLATTAVLFQAPDPAARPRRRRAQVATGSPEEISQAAQTAEQSAADERAAAQAATAEPAAAEPDATTPAAEENEGAGRSRRRGRGGRGRSRRAADDAIEQEATVGAEEPDDDAAPVPDDLPAEVDLDAEAADDDEDEDGTPRRRRRRGGRGRRGRAETADDDDAEGSPGAGDVTDTDTDTDTDADTDADRETDHDDAAGDDDAGGSSRRRRRRRRGTRGEAAVEEPRRSRPAGDEVTALRGSTRLEAKRQRRREGRDAGRRRQIITEAEFLARRESVERSMIVRERHGRTQIAVLEDGVLVEHYVSNQAQSSMVGNVYLGRVQNVLPSMEAAFVDVGKGRNAVLYAGEVNWDAAGLEGQPRRIEQALKSGDPVLVQVTKDPIGHKGARLTSQVTLAGRYLVYVPGGGMTGISRKLPDTERSRLKKILRDVVPDSAGVIVRTAAEGASEAELRADVVRLQAQWEAIEKKARTATAPALLQGEPDMAIRVVRDIFNDDFSSLVVEGEDEWTAISSYVGELAPDLAARVSKWTGTQDVFSVHRVDEQLAKGMDRKVWLPSGGSLVIDRTEAMTVIDVNTGKFTGAGGTLEETVTRNNLEAAEEIVRQLRLRDIGGIIVIDFIDMVLESNRDLVLRRLVECLGRDRTKHQVAEVTSLGLVQMTRKRVGQGLVEAFSETCEHCHGRGFVVHADPIEKNGRPDAGAPQAPEGESKRARRKRGSGGATAEPTAAAAATVPVLPEAREAVKATLATIAAAAAHAHEHEHEHEQVRTEVVVTAEGADDADHDDAHHDDAAGFVVEETVVDVTTEVVVEAEVGPGAPAGAQPALDVLAELAAAGVASAPRRRGRATRVQAAPADAPAPASPPAPAAPAPEDAVLELHAVAPEVFETADDDETDAAVADAVADVAAEDEAVPGGPAQGEPGEE